MKSFHIYLLGMLWGVFLLVVDILTSNSFGAGFATCYILWMAVSAWMAHGD